MLFSQWQSGKCKLSSFRMLSECHYFEQFKSFLFGKELVITSSNPLIFPEVNENSSLAEKQALLQ